MPFFHRLSDDRGEARAKGGGMRGAAVSVAGARPLLFVLNELRHSGAEIMLACSLGEWREAGFAPTLLALGREAGPLAPRLRQAGYPVVHLPFGRDPLFLVRLYRFLRASPWAMVHIHCERANFWIALMAWLAGRRQLCRTVHALFPFTGHLGWKRRWQRRLARTLLQVRMVAVSTAVAANEAERFANPCLVIPNWLDVSHFRPPAAEERAAARQALDLPPGGWVLVVVGQCGAVKNHAALLHALAALTPSERPLLLHAGSSPEEEGERRLAAALGLTPGEVRFLGVVDDVRTLYWAADAFVMPSLREGVGIAALEAIACGVPAILAATPGLTTLRELGEGICWVEPTAAALTGALQLMGREREAWRAHHAGELAARVRQEFRPEAGVARHAACYAAPPGASREA